MKIFGKKYDTPHRESVYFPREDDIIEITAEAIVDDADFYKYCKEPKAPIILVKGRGRIPDYEDKYYKSAVEVYKARRTALIIITSLRATPGLEWDKVKLDNPDTWLLYREELKDFGFSMAEINQITNTVLAANSLDDAKLQEARERFLALQRVAAQGSSSQEEEKQATQSGELVNGSV